MLKSQTRIWFDWLIRLWSDATHLLLLLKKVRNWTSLGQICFTLLTLSSNFLDKVKSLSWYYRLLLICALKIRYHSFLSWRLLFWLVSLQIILDWCVNFLRRLLLWQHRKWNLHIWLGTACKLLFARSRFYTWNRLLLRCARLLGQRLLNQSLSLWR